MSKGVISIEELIYTLTSLLFLLLGVVLIVSIVMSTINPYDQIAYANVERLRATMEEVCVTGQEKTMTFDLPQNTPRFTSIVPVMPIWIIKTNGDPNYVLYYEAFPVGDATGWEVYHGMQNRLVTSYSGKEGDSELDVRAQVDEVGGLWKERVVNDAPTRISTNVISANLHGIIVNNIMLGGPRSDYFRGDQDFLSPRAYFESEIGNEAERLGKWKEVQSQDIENPVPAEGDNVFEFNNYMSLTSFEKTSIKYAPCGDNALCFKTRSGVHRVQLRNCDNIKYVELVYDARNRAKFYTALGVVVVSAVVVAGTTVAVGALIPAGATAIAPGVYAWRGATILGSAGKVTGVIGTPFGATVGSVAKIAGGWFLKGLLNILKFSWKRSKIITIGGVTYGVEQIGEAVGGIFLSYKVQDFNIASSCSIKEMKIRKIRCEELECKRVVSYPIYQYGGDGKLTTKDADGKDMVHYTCLEKIGKEIDKPEGTGFNDGQCLQVMVEEKDDGFCWTRDPYRDNLYSDTQWIAQGFGLTPIYENTAYISSPDAKAIVLKYYPPITLEKWKEIFERLLSWGWPG